jgi:hypothetical protein
MTQDHFGHSRHRLERVLDAITNRSSVKCVRGLPSGETFKCLRVQTLAFGFVVYSRAS